MTVSWELLEMRVMERSARSACLVLLLASLRSSEESYWKCMLDLRLLCAPLRDYLINYAAAISLLHFSSIIA